MKQNFKNPHFSPVSVIFLSITAPITADAATTKVLGAGKTFTVKKTTSVSGLSKAEKKIVKVSVNKKKRTVTVKGLKPGKATFKVGKKSYTVKVGAVKIKKKDFETTLTAGTNQTVKVIASYGANDTLAWTSSKKSVVKVSKATTKASSKKIATNVLKPGDAGSATITVKSKNTGKKLSIKVKVKAAVTPTATPSTVATPSTAPTTTGSAVPSTTPVTNPSTVPTATGSATPSTDPSAVPTATGSAVPSAEPSAAPTEVPTTAPTQTPEVVSASVVSAGAVNTQEQEVSLNAVTKNGSIEVTFSETVKESSINNTNFTITDANGKNISIPASDVKLAIGGKKAVVSIKNLGLDKKATYTLSVKNIETAKGDKVVDYKTAFTVANVAVVNNVKLSSNDASDELSTNMDAKDTWAGKQITIKYDELLDSTTVNAANIELVNTTTGERVPVTFETSSTDGTITIKTNVSLTARNLYKIVIKGVKTAVNGTAEDLTHTFTVNGVKPLSDKSILSYKTLDGNSVRSSVSIWPKLTAGNKEINATDTKYYAGIQFNVAVSESLDAASVKECVYLVEKETKEIVAANVSYNEEAKMIVIVPAADLKEDTDYQIQYLGGLRTTDYVYLDSNKKNDVYTSETVDFRTMDVTSPEVISIESKSGTNGLEVTKAQEFVVTFTEGVNLSNSNILLAETSVDVETTNAAGVSVNVSEVAGSDGKQWTIKIPANSLQADKAYKLRVLGKDSKNWATKGTLVSDIYTMPNYLKKTSTYTFSTENDTTAPKLVNVYEGRDITDASKVLTSTKTNVKANDEFTFVFDEKVQTTGDAKLEILEKGTWKEEGSVLSLTSQKNKDGEDVAVIVTIPASVNQDAKYRIVFEKGVIRDKANADVAKCNEFDLYRYEFVATAGDDDVTSVNMYSGNKADGSDASEPAVTGTVKVDGRFFIVLDEKDITGLTAENVSVTDADGNAVAGEVKEVTDSKELASSSKAVYAFIPTANLAYGTNYTVKVSGVTDIVGNKIATKAVTFKTVSEKNKITAISIENGAVSVNRKATITIDLNNKNAANVENVALGKIGGNTLTQGTDYTIEKNDDGNKYTIKFVGSQELEANTTYELAISAGNVSDTSNDKKITFTTGLDSKDVVNPTLVAGGIKVGDYTMEKGGLKAASKAAKTIVLIYDEKVKKDDVKVTIVNVTDSTKTPVISGKTLSSDGTALTLTVAGFDATNGGTYKVDISGVKDEAGNAADAISFFVELKDLTDYSTKKSGAEDALSTFSTTNNVENYKAAKAAVDAFVAVGGNVADLAADEYTDVYKNYQTTLKTAAETAVAELVTELGDATVDADVFTKKVNLDLKCVSAKTAIDNYTSIGGTATSLVGYDTYLKVANQKTANAAITALKKAANTIGAVVENNNTGAVTFKTNGITGVTDIEDATLGWAIKDSVDGDGTDSAKFTLTGNILSVGGNVDSSYKATITATVTVGGQTATLDFSATSTVTTGVIAIAIQ